ncbi:hybrid sensor histidine kinase/response regulator transcription factor [Sphingobacterium sp. SGR-19]|uniref:hybrid sensor histidine kinase/response regulator transcription factor n=1 Tax=Sphingobacterium sp. SGR-19 TaxID=2710886 RepID=UPI0013EBF369|nr:hybrid sensor histidine kinase/response regulator transcription factor [Sphingobacterium sp. SGR-19]NGM64545.1 response regulator [Sphingobacterium sp. SGR-19]
MSIGLHSHAQFLQLKFDHITSEDGLPQSTIHGIAKDKHGFMWFGTWSGLCRYDGYTIRVYRYDAHNTRSLINNRVHNILADKNGDLWISTFDEQYLCRYRYETDDFERLPMTDCPPELKDKINRRNHRLQVSFSYQQTRWHLDNLSTTLVETHLPSGKQKTYTVDAGNPWSINDAYVSDIFLDDQQVIWLGTYSNGINRSYLDASPFHYLYHDPQRSNSLIENIVRSITEDKDGNLWVGTRSKGVTLVKKNGQYQHFQHNLQTAHSIQNNYIKKVFCDSEGYVWIGSQSGLDRYDPRRRIIEQIGDSTALNTGVYGMAEDADGDIWLATWNGVSKFNRRHKEIETYDLSSVLTEQHVWTIFIDSKGQIWAGTEGAGIFIFSEAHEGQLKLIRRLHHGSQTATSLSDNRIYSIFEDRENQIWIGTGNGLDCYAPQTDSVKQFAQLGSLWPKGTIAGVTEDNNGFIWASHKQGISRINKKTLDIRTFSKQDGLQSNEFADGAVYRSLYTNRLYFGGNKGINHFSPDSIRTNKTPPKVVLTELRILNQPVEVNQQVNGRVVLAKPLYLVPSIALTHEDKSISIEFSALHFANPAGNQYAYMLEGFDKDWIYGDADKRVASYSNLAPGDYTFKVKASNSDGVWAAVPTELSISVAPALWASTEAYVLYTFIFILLLYAFYYYITRYAKLKSKLNYEAILHEKERELHESKVQFFTNISHEIKTPLTLILSPIQQLKTWGGEDLRIHEQLKTMETNGQHLLKTVNQLLDIRRFETGNEELHLEKTELLSLIQKVVDSFSQQARQKKIRLKVASSQPEMYATLDADKIEKVLYNLLSNALKFTDSGNMVKVRILQHNEHLNIDVIDNGKGIPPEDLERIFKPFLQGRSTVPGGTGLGLSYSKTLVEMHGGKLTVESRANTKRNKLTIFRILLPIAHDSTTITVSKEVAPTHDHADTSTTSATTRQAFVEQLPLLPRKCTLLLVEDNDQMRSYLAQFFRSDYYILEAPNGEQGLKLASRHVPDLIISDVMMPEIDGISFTRQVKSDILLRHIPVILLTARTWVEYEVEGLETGADDYMVKPFHLPILALKVRNQLLTRFHIQEKFQHQVSIEPTKIDPQSPDEVLLHKVLIYIEEHVQDSDLKIENICQAIGLSRAQLYRKMKALTGYSMNDLIKEIRLKRAQQLLQDHKFQINEIAYMVGFSDPEYFRKSFKAKIGCSPSAYAKQHRSSVDSSQDST